MSGMMG